ncbi:Hypothetical protein DHA2_154355 [Giardia duodenalis]|uniref:Uncharacterized protein n=1 Tax=Giardia intestinalis TaxID=5741 RepID=V6T8D6_GIAIN|nr:Hypothetical protein DHA2_154355 [Giardia intestinalis]
MLPHVHHAGRPCMVGTMGVAAQGANARGQRLPSRLVCNLTNHGTCDLLYTNNNVV